VRARAARDEWPYWHVFSIVHRGVASDRHETRVQIRKNGIVARYRDKLLSGNRDKTANALSGERVDCGTHVITASVTIRFSDRFIFPFVFVVGWEGSLFFLAFRFYRFRRIATTREENKIAAE